MFFFFNLIKKKRKIEQKEKKMNLSARDVINVGSSMVLGGIICGLCNLANMYLNRRAGAPLMIETKYLCFNVKLLSFCKEIENRFSDSDYYFKSIKKIDQLAKMLYKHQQKKKIKKITFIYKIHSDLCYNLKMLMEEYNKKTKSTIKQVDFENLIQRLIRGPINDMMIVLSKIENKIH